MLDGLTWIIAIAAALTGGLALALSGIILLRQRTVSMRFGEMFETEGYAGSGIDRLLSSLEQLGRRLAGGSVSPEVRDLVVQAGFFTGSAPYIFLALRLAFAVFFTILMLFWLQATQGIGPVQIAIGIVFGYLVYRYALIAVKLLAERRAAKVRREMPPVLDIMLMVLDAGVSVDQALRHLSVVVPKTAPVSGFVLKRLIADVESGVPYDAALDRMGYRLGVDEGQDFANIIKQALLSGGELGSTLRRFSADLSDIRMAQARESVGKKATHLTMVMILFFMPVLLIVLAGPAAVQLTEGIGSVARQMHESGATQ
ncbi:tight adherence protein C [Parvibaculum indicum]|uniref:type II secretion system F family protein n=1 Tax=Parvibaculum indicum TaxID=562969 RepID=UPI00141FBD30|nr:type II secretion system F family protein [Parvibaculum indicum]NIJ43222.1 tight adherence protein C [Parvibaculum indicum]